MRTNHRIRVPEIRCINANGDQLGVIPTSRGRMLAEQQGLDLVEIAPNASPPVCRIMDYGKFRYEQEKKDKEARRHQVAGKVKEIKLHANVEEHDFDTKMRHARDFIQDGHRVKFSLFFRGRENAHTELGFEVMKRVIRSIEDVSQPDQMPTRVGRAIFMMMSPKRALRQAQQQAAAARPSATASAPAAPPGPRPAGAPTTPRPAGIPPNSIAIPSAAGDAARRN